MPILLRSGCAALLLCVFLFLTPSESFTGIVVVTPTRSTRKATTTGHHASLSSSSFPFIITTRNTHESSPRCNKRRQRNVPTAMAADPSNANNETVIHKSKKNKSLPMILDIGTKGGVLFLSGVLFCVPLLLYQCATTVGGVDPEKAGVAIGVGFTSVVTLGWVSTLLVRVMNKDMTYVRERCHTI